MRRVTFDAALPVTETSHFGAGMEPDRPSAEALMRDVADIISRSQILTFIVNNPVARVWSKTEPDHRKNTLNNAYYQKFKCPILPEALKSPEGRESLIAYGRRILNDFRPPESGQKREEPRRKPPTPLMVCYDFSGVVIGALRNAKALRLAASNPSFDSIELYHAGRKGNDHAFVVINRKRDTDERDLTAWGDDAFIVDAWYAAQRDPGEKAGSCPVKGLKPDTRFYDEGYINWLKPEPLSVTADFS